MTLLSVRGLGGGYGGPPAIEDLEFDVEPGHLVAVLGPNGGGKTTLFRALLGELGVRRGEVRVDAPLAHLPQHDHARLDFPVSALDVVLMGVEGPWWRRRDRASAHAALARLGLAEQAGAPYGSLSGGQRRRVALARALVAGATVLLLDEPMSGVDAVSAARIESAFDELRAEGRALLVATHDVVAARRADRVLCLHRRQIAFGPPEILTTEVLRATYGEELVVLEDGALAVAVDHHDHAH
jgi:ABC-type Mn2+/Zn2+ transport system ATPase subunit